MKKYRSRSSKIESNNTSGILIVILLIAILTVIFIFTFLFIFYISSISPVVTVKPNIQDPNMHLSPNFVRSVIDGDTFDLSSDVRVRLLCINAPELGTAGSLESKQYLEGLILGKEVILKRGFDDMDRYGRLLRYVYINVSGKDQLLNVNKEILDHKYAVLYPYGNETCDDLK